MDLRYVAGLIVGGSVIAFLCNVASHAQSPQVPGRPMSLPDSAKPRARNLKVLPQDISDAQIIQLMVRYGQELGVQCGFCHAEDPQTQQVDFASDENPRKQTARIMIGMVGDINNKYLAEVDDRRYAVPITCGNCHQGQTYPPAFQAGSTP
jgi:photosynthetic reaction center cytochrome c subunit